MIRQLIRNKVFDGERLLGTMVVAIDGSGHVSFGRRHCPHCLTQTHGDVTSYFHEVLEAKRVTSSGLALSMGSEFIDNRHFDGLPEAGRESRKQDCELKAFARLAAQLKRDFPQLRLCLAADALMTFGPVFQACKDHGWHYVLTFKEGRLPAVWEDFQSLMPLVPRQVRRLTTPDQRELEYRWVNGLSYVDDQDRSPLPSKEDETVGKLRTKDSIPRRTSAMNWSMSTAPTKTCSRATTSCCRSPT